MNIHEYQAKQILSQFGIKVPAGSEADTPQTARDAAARLGGDSWVVKAQIHAGGRGKAGGIKLAGSLEEVEKIAGDILGKKLVTHQTGEKGKIVRKIYVEKTVAINKEFYLGVVLDRATEMPVMIASSEGGVEIEKVAAATPDKIVKTAIDPLTGFRSYHARELGFGIGLNKDRVKVFSGFAAALFKAYYDNDCSLVEINPLVLTDEEDFVALDAKMVFDDNSLFRHENLLSLRDLAEEEPAEVEAGGYGLSYVKLDGDVGCMVNGAGLAMSTMDIIKLSGGEPANFLDVGGAASVETVSRGFQIILRDENVKAIFVNIFGGIVRCDRIAGGILEALEKISIKVPLVVRLDGTNAGEAAEILRNAGVGNILTADDLADGARKAVQAARGI